MSTMELDRIMYQSHLLGQRPGWCRPSQSLSGGAPAFHTALVTLPQKASQSWGAIRSVSLQQHTHQLGLGMRRIAAIGPVHGRRRDLRYPIAVIAMVDATDCNGKESSAPLAAKIS
ncbi:TPA: hypothetical protein L6A23_31435 [Pseudomonas aeruginosa]|nr:Uncharacterised protein [Acinetobacter baumannii]HBP5995789.1 hypothetical protein [Pseudomonas aeruginosa]HBP5996693.1 hypothetical protein [Pseudomonas aeruginosa]